MLPPGRTLKTSKGDDLKMHFQKCFPQVPLCLQLKQILKVKPSPFQSGTRAEVGGAADGAAGRWGDIPAAAPGTPARRPPPHPWWLSSSNCFCLLRAQVSAQPGLLLPPPGQEQKATGPCLHPRIRGRGSQKVDAASTARFGDELGVWDTQAQLPWRGLSSHCREESRALPAPCSRLLLETNYNTCISKIGNP